MHCLSCTVIPVPDGEDLCIRCRRFWDDAEDDPPRTERDIIPPVQRKDAPMPHGARHIACALRDAHRLGGLLDPADTRLEAERADDGWIRAKGPEPGRGASAAAWYAHMILAPVPCAPSPEAVDWRCGLDAVAWTLGFDEGGAELMAWAEANPDLWGGEDNLALLDPARAGGCPITTLEDAAHVFDALARAAGE